MSADYTSVLWVMNQANRYPLLDPREEITITRTIVKSIKRPQFLA